MWFQESKRTQTRFFHDGRLQPDRGRSGEARQSNAAVAQEFAARALVRWPFFLLDHRFMFVLLFLHPSVLPGFSAVGLISWCLRGAELDGLPSIKVNESMSAISVFFCQRPL